jgi:serine/threonine protein phosphatase PrpC
LAPDELGFVLSKHFYGEAGSALISMANERGGDDNITCVIVYVANVLAAPSGG